LSSSLLPVLCYARGFRGQAGQQCGSATARAAYIHAISQHRASPRRHVGGGNHSQNKPIPGLRANSRSQAAVVCLRHVIMEEHLDFCVGVTGVYTYRCTSLMSDCPSPTPAFLAPTSHSFWSPCIWRAGGPGAPASSSSASHLHACLSLALSFRSSQPSQGVVAYSAGTSRGSATACERRTSTASRRAHRRRESGTRSQAGCGAPGRAGVSRRKEGTLSSRELQDLIILLWSTARRSRTGRPGFYSCLVLGAGEILPSWCV
jgi:hypothetical protein